MNRNLLIFSFNLLTLVALVVPGGQILGFKIYLVAFILTIFFVVVDLLYITRKFFSKTTFILILLASNLFLLVWLGIGIVSSNATLDGISNSYRLFFMTINYVYISYYLYKNKIIRIFDFFEYIINGAFIFCLIKVIVTACIFLNLVSLPEVMSFLKNTFDYEVVTQDISTNNLYRFQFQNDTITPILLIVLFLPNYFNLQYKLNKLFLIIIYSISIFISFSRWLWFLGIFLTCITFIYQQRSLLSNFTKRSLTKKNLVSIFYASLILLLITLNINTVSDTFAYRFFEKETVASDEVRESQYQALTSEIGQYPILGKGLGGYTEKIIRDPDNPHYYEMQWLAFTLQIGFLGMFILLIHLFYIGYNIYRIKMKEISLILVLSYLLWLFSGFSNPYMLSPISGIIFTLFLLSSFCYKDTQV
jgi:hypothetical protein